MNIKSITTSTTSLLSVLIFCSACQTNRSIEDIWASAEIHKVAPKEAQEDIKSEVNKNEKKSVAAETPVKKTTTDFVIQVGSFSDLQNAKKLFEQLWENGIKANLKRTAPFHSVQVRSFSNQKQAEEVGKQILKVTKEINHIYITHNKKIQKWIKKEPKKTQATLPAPKEDRVPASEAKEPEVKTTPVEKPKAKEPVEKKVEVSEPTEKAEEKKPASFESQWSKEN